MTVNFSVPGALPVMEQWLANYLRDLERLVTIDSNTHDKAGVDRVGEVPRDFYKELGATVDVDPRADFGDNLVVRLRGSGSGKVLLLGHTDTVYPTGTVLQRPFVREGKQAIGPGTADMKAGDLAIVYALRLLRRQNFDTFDTITVVHNSDEEIGSPGSKDLIRHHAEASDAVFVLEAGRENGDIVSGRKGIASFTLNVCGRSAHAGVNRDRGRSAALELAHLVVALENLNGRVPGATLNVGWIEAGGAVNVVPENGLARFEARAFSIERLQEMVTLVEHEVARRTVTDTQATVHHAIEHYPMHKSEGTINLLREAQSLAASVGLELRDTITGGASDGNTAAAAGRPVLDGLGPVGGGAHSSREYIDVESVGPRTAILAGLIASVGAKRRD
ncbi:MAG: M20 family metallopeptidase [Chloroflexota bacterium]